MPIAECPACKAVVLFGADGLCPSCQSDSDSVDLANVGNASESPQKHETQPPPSGLFGVSVWPSSRARGFIAGGIMGGLVGGGIGAAWAWFVDGPISFFIVFLTGLYGALVGGVGGSILGFVVSAGKASQRADKKH